MQKSILASGFQKYHFLLCQLCRPSSVVLIKAQALIMVIYLFFPS